ncbi:uncharacterized protein EAE97_008609 [Botrytis byssoidea]|uniref:Uncharacterized protein n=1 Tax=Botrytis byssoidea TaxID=139641 RepID=A0A9P5LPV5_9HELO|nr:uncharacterized protein EAE97_008609 [Botrytis byssoidea]KAF7934249.1 hypothetical protein EAE97_008609 [Botrytis byssoidea]
MTVGASSSSTNNQILKAVGKLTPSIVGILLSLHIWVYAEQINPGYMHTIVTFYGYDCAWTPHILINGLNVSPSPSLEDLSVCVLSIGAA